MKNLITLFIVLESFLSANAQQEAPPQGINYQAVAVDNSKKETVGIDLAGKPVVEKEIRVRFTILKSSETGSLTYREVHLVTTDAYGLFNTVIGKGIPDVSPINFDQIDWSTGYHFLKVEIDITGGTDYTDMGTQQLWSVPYSLYSKFANTAGNGIDSVSDNGDGTLTFTYLDGSTYSTPTLTGLTGPQGPAGETGATGPIGQSAYELWLAQGNTGTQQQFLNSLVGPQGPAGPQGLPGAMGLQGPIGLTGSPGSNGTNGFNSLIKTTIEPLGSNCTNGGTKIETGLDVNSNGILDPSEINVSLTKYVCNGATGPQGLVGATGPQGPAGLSCFSSMQVYSTPGSYTFTIPTGINKIMIEAWGGGGGGGNAHVSAAGTISSGAGGGYGKEIFSVTPGTTYTIIVGAGGTSSGGTGGTSSFGSLITATGGQGGCNLGSPSFYLAAGGTSNAVFNVTGEAGIINGNNTAGLKGGDSFGSSGGRAGMNGVVASPGNSPGGGGASGSGYSTSSLTIGAVGGSGRIVVWY